MKPTSRGQIKDVVEASKVVEKKCFYHGILTNIYKMKCLEMELVYMKVLFLISPRADSYELDGTMILVSIRQFFMLLFQNRRHLLTNHVKRSNLWKNSTAPKISPNAIYIAALGFS